MTLTRSGTEIADYFDLAMGEGQVVEMDGGSLHARYNIAPSQQIATVARLINGDRAFSWRKWGLVPSWSVDAAVGGRLFNARAETADQKPSFRAAWKRRRCLVVADGFYEWTALGHDRQPYHFHSSEASLLGLAGLYETWHGPGGEVVESCTVLTTEANADLEGIHQRMPVILDSSRFDAWLDPTSDSALLKAMMVPALVGALERWAVSRRMNSPRFDDPQCLLPELGREREPVRPVPKAEQGELFRSGGDDAK